MTDVPEEKRNQWNRKDTETQQKKLPLNYGSSYCAPRIRVRQAPMNLVSVKEKGRVGAQRKRCHAAGLHCPVLSRCKRTGNHAHRATAQKLTSGQVAAYVQKQRKTFLNMQTCRNVSPCEFLNKPKPVHKSKNLE